jgi:rod shape-determining protein MreC
MKLSRPSPFRAFTVLTALALAAVVLLVLDRAGRLAPVREQADRVIVPALGGLSSVSRRVESVGQGISELQQLRDRVQALEQENSQLKAANIRSQALEQENERLRRQVRLETERPWQLLGAEVLAHSPDPGRHLLTLRAGRERGVKPGMAVIGQEGSSPPTLIGVVTAVTPRTATVLLINDFSSAITARVFHQGSSTDGILQGQPQPGAELRLLQVDRSTPLAPGDTVVTAGLTAQLAPDLPGAEVPANVPLGVVSSARIQGNTQEALVRPYVDPAGVRYAWVLLNADG